MFTKIYLLCYNRKPQHRVARDRHHNCSSIPQHRVVPLGHQRRHEDQLKRTASYVTLERGCCSCFSPPLSTIPSSTYLARDESMVSQRQLICTFSDKIHILEHLRVYLTPTSPHRQRRLSQPCFSLRTAPRFQIRKLDKVLLQHKKSNAIVGNRDPHFPDVGALPVPLDHRGTTAGGWYPTHLHTVCCRASSSQEN